eukprot:TRINITY_DN911_c0_g3_i1.p1 TRINITY_DN911_c0_g3~~TRINITY_DN911_c0_g3_i1.p1  ORF type:complete len:350 (-),score=42.15 TRINITY_DN911_c0_g3_i1:40-1089(-)
MRHTQEGTVPPWQVRTGWISSPPARRYSPSLLVSLAVLGLLLPGPAHAHAQTVTSTAEPTITPTPSMTAPGPAQTVTSTAEPTITPTRDPTESRTHSVTSTVYSQTPTLTASPVSPSCLAADDTRDCLSSLVDFCLTEARDRDTLDLEFTTAVNLTAQQLQHQLQSTFGSQVLVSVEARDRWMRDPEFKATFSFHPLLREGVISAIIRLRQFLLPLPDDPEISLRSCPRFYPTSADGLPLLAPECDPYELFADGVHVWCPASDRFPTGNHQTRGHVPAWPEIVKPVEPVSAASNGPCTTPASAADNNSNNSNNSSSSNTPVLALLVAILLVQLLLLRRASYTSRKTFLP